MKTGSLKNDKTNKIEASPHAIGGSATNCADMPKGRSGSLKVSPSLPGAKPLEGGTTKTFSDSADCEKVSFKPEIVDIPTKHTV